ncbi:hypothetical protein Tco_0732209 [Tanacetum coccineum]
MVTLSHHLSCIKKETEVPILDKEFKGMTLLRLSKMLQGTYIANELPEGYKNGKGYAANDFVGEDDVVIPNRSINDPFLNKLCNGSYINDFSDKPDVGESSQPCGKELEIDSDDEDVDNISTIYDLAEGRSSGKKGKKGKYEDELPKKDKGLLLRSPKKGKDQKPGMHCVESDRVGWIASERQTSEVELLTAMG